MSHSVIEVIEPDLGDSLTLIVGEDGIIRPDKATVTSILSSRPTTDLNIMYMTKCNGNTVDVTLDTLKYIHTDDIEDSDEEELDEIARNLKSFQLDHDYTSLAPSPEEFSNDDDQMGIFDTEMVQPTNRPSVNHHSVSLDEDELAQALELLDGSAPNDSYPEPQTTHVHTTTSSLQTSTKTITRSKVASSNTNLRASVVSTRRQSDKDTIGGKTIPVAEINRRKSAELNADTVSPIGKGAGEEDDDYEEDISSDELLSDDDNDEDFLLDDEKRSRAKKPPKPPKPVVEKAPKPAKLPKVRKPKTPRPARKSSLTATTTTSAEKDADAASSTTLPDPTKPVVESFSRVVEVKKQSGLPPKKEKKVPKPMPDDFALFSTPDVIRRISDSKPVPIPFTPTTTTVSVSESLSGTPTPKPAKIFPENRARNKSTEQIQRDIGVGVEPSLSKKQQPLEIKRPSVESRVASTTIAEPTTAGSEPKTSAAIEQVCVQEFETNSSSESLGLEPLPSAEDIRAIIQSETTKTFTTYTDSHNESASSVVTSQQMALDTTNPNTVGSAANSLDQLDPALLDNIDNGLIDDVLYQVAQTLAENTELQNVIDKSIKDGVLDASGIEPSLLPSATSTILESPRHPLHLHASNNSHTNLPRPQQHNPSIPSHPPTTPQPQPTQIIRPDGRIIILPPVERPTTRSRKKRDDGSTVSSATSSPAAATTPVRHSTPVTTPVSTPKTNVVTTPVTTATRTPKPSAKLLDDQHVSGNELDSSDEGEEESEDDPNKLWCVCNQPHNNRFMICCDTCEEWYHGKCVNVTKAMGQLMEQQGREWICIYCKDKSLTRPKAAARRIRKASRTSTDSSSSNMLTVDPQTPTTKSEPKSEGKKPSSAPIKKGTTCVVCPRPSRPASIYCSHECILKHAQGVEKVVVYNRKTNKILTGPDAPTVANLEQWLKEHPSYEVVRPAKKTKPVGVSHSQMTNMTQSKLKLIRNDNSPGSGVSLAVQRKGVSIGVLKHAPLTALSSSTPSPTAAVPPKKPGTKILNSTLAMPGQLQQQPKMTRLIPAAPRVPKIVQSKLVVDRTPKTPTNATEKSLPEKSPNSAAAIAGTSFLKDKPLKNSAEKKTVPVKTPKARQAEAAASTAATPPKQDNIREGIKKSLYEQLLNRIKLSEDDIKFTEDEVLKISEEIETQLFKCFADTGQKYRNKYRSLIFNIKDTKNQTLWRKICENAISPYQLVRLSPDDLASQELALWRERETKHQLDMIKKNEMEMMNCRQQYVFKTHKGEQVFEDETPKAKVNDVIGDNLATDTSAITTTTNSDSDKSRSRDRKRKSSSSSKKRSDRSRDRNRDRDRSKGSKDDTDSKISKDGKEKNSGGSKRKRSRSRERSRHDKKRSRSRDKHREKDRSKSSHRSSRHTKDKKDSDINKLDKKSTELYAQLIDKNILKPMDEDKLWKHIPQDDVIRNPSIESDSDHEPTSTVTIPTPPRSSEPEDGGKKSILALELQSTPPVVDDDSSPRPSPKANSSEGSADSSPFSLDTLWKGTLTMADVAQISVTAQEVSGECAGLSGTLPNTLEIIGRISPDTVWDYITKSKCSNSRQITLLRLNAINMEEKMQYIALYSYLSMRNRLGVVKVSNMPVKDFYILPLASHKPIPPALMPLSGPGFEESRPALLVAIIIRDRRKRGPDTVPPPATVPKRVKTIDITASPPVVTKPVEIIAAPARIITPPPSRDPRTAKIVEPVAEIPVTVEKIPVAKKDDGDEPYSPEDSDPDSVLVPTTINTSVSGTFLDPSVTKTTFDPFSNAKFDTIPGLDDAAVIPSSSQELQRKMAELDQRIAMQKAEIDNMSQDIVTTANTDLGTTLLSKIAIPSDLQQILENIKTIGGTVPVSTAEPEQEYQHTWEPPPGIQDEQVRAASTNFPPNNSQDLTIPLMLPKSSSRVVNTQNAYQPSAPVLSNNSSVLSTLSETDLMRKAAEMLGENDMHKLKQMATVPPPILAGFATMPAVPPPPPLLHAGHPPSMRARSQAMPLKRAVELMQPAIPGLEDEF